MAFHARTAPLYLSLLQGGLFLSCSVFLHSGVIFSYDNQLPSQQREFGLASWQGWEQFILNFLFEKNDITWHNSTAYISTWLLAIKTFYIIF